MYSKIVLVLLLLAMPLFACQSMHAQIDPDDSFVIELGLPNGMVNAPFKNIMQGLVYISPMYQYTTKSGLSLGGGLHYSFFSVNQFRINQKVSGGMHTGAAFLKLGHEKFWNNALATDIALKGGVAQSVIITDALKASGVGFLPKTCLYLEPNIGLCLASEVNASFRLTIGYAIYGFGFKPWDLGVNSTLGYSQAELNKVTSFLVVGFGYSRYFNGKKSTDSGWGEE